MIYVRTPEGNVCHAVIVPDCDGKSECLFVIYSDANEEGVRVRMIDIPSNGPRD